MANDTPLGCTKKSVTQIEQDHPWVSMGIHRLPLVPGSLEFAGMAGRLAGPGRCRELGCPGDPESVVVTRHLRIVDVRWRSGYAKDTKNDVSLLSTQPS